MERQAAVQEIRSRWRELLPMISRPAKSRVNGEQSYVCPICGHGEHGDGLTFNPQSRDGNGLRCFGCGFSGDDIDLCQKMLGENDLNKVLDMMADDMGITIDPYRVPDQKQPVRIEHPAAAAQDQRRSDPEADQQQADYTEYYQECARRITDPRAVSYLQGRGISLATAQAYQIGFDPEADPANAPGALTDEGKKHPSPRIIIPTTASHYIGRSIYDDSRVKGEARNADGSIRKYDYRKLNPSRSKGAGSAGIFNIGALYAQGVQEVFVVEGAMDALSIIEAGQTAIALNSTSNYTLLLKELEARPTAATLIICFDNDPDPNTREKVRKLSEELREGLNRLNIPCVISDVCCGEKDANAALQADRESFMAAVEEAVRGTAKKPDSVSYYIEKLMAADIEKSRNVIKTGFSNLDKESGGLNAGLYVLAAISSLGKTSFALQIADQIASSGEDVIFFSLEQSRLELVSKSIARTTAQISRKDAVNSLSIRRGYMPDIVLRAADQYREKVGDHLSIVEGNFSCDSSFIRDYIRQYVKRTGERPVVILDYLQVLQPGQQNGRQQTTKETVDATVTDLKRISRELELPIIAICSVNRANYLSQIDYESLKESGNIEYTADVIWGLQLQCMHDPIFEKEKCINEKRAAVKEAKAADPRKIELCCLKNRFGISSYSCFFNYYPKNDLFDVCEDSDLDLPEADPKRSKRTI